MPVFDDSRDQWLLNNLRSLGYTILNPALVIANAREACRLLQQGESTAQMNQQMQARMGASTIDTLQAHVQRDACLPELLLAPSGGDRERPSAESGKRPWGGPGDIPDPLIGLAPVFSLVARAVQAAALRTWGLACSSTCSAIGTISNMIGTFSGSVGSLAPPPACSDKSPRRQSRPQAP